jgi:nucleotide-binding universal stress UspA family protein
MMKARRVPDATDPKEAILPKCLAYMPLDTFPEAISDEAILKVIRFAAALECSLHVSTFSVSIPRSASPVGGFLLNVPGMVRSTEDKSKAECSRLKDLAGGEAEAMGLQARCTIHQVVLGSAPRIAASEARYFDVSLFPFPHENVAAQDLAQSLVFGSGRPTVLVPPTADLAKLDHIAIAWDGSRVAARALGDALPLLAAGGHMTVLTVEDEKPLAEQGLASALAATLERRGISAKAVGITLGGRTIAEALQQTAVSHGARLLAMGGFGHSRIRDFVLGGATKGVFKQLRLPVLLSH